MKSSITAIEPDMAPRSDALVHAPSLSARLAEWALPIVIVSAVIPIAVSFFFINASIRLDEAQSLWQVSRNVSGILTIVAGDVHVPFYHLLLHYWLILFGNTVQVARLLSLLFFVLSVPMLYALGKRAYSANAGLLAAFLFSISPFMNWYGNEIRMYTLFVFLTIVNQYCFVRISKDRETGGLVWFSYGISALLGIFTHYFFFLNLLAQAVFYVIRRRTFPEHSLRRFIIVAAIIAVAFAPWVWYEFYRGVAAFQRPLLPRPSTVDLFGTFSQFLFGFQQDFINTGLLSLWPLAAIVALIGLDKRRMSLSTEYFVLTLIVAFGATFIGSYLVTPVYVSRYLIFTIPALYLVLINLFSSYTQSARLLAKGALVVLMILTLGIEIMNPAVPVKEEYASAASYLMDHTTPQDIILLSAPFTIYPIQYYYRGTAVLQTLPLWDQYAFGPIPPYNAATFPDQVTTATHNYQNAYLLLSYDQGYEKAVKDYFDSHYQLITMQNFSHDLTLYVYRLRYNTARSAISVSL